MLTQKLYPKNGGRIHVEVYSAIFEAELIILIKADFVVHFKFFFDRISIKFWWTVSNYSSSINGVFSFETSMKSSKFV